MNENTKKLYNRARRLRAAAVKKAEQTNRHDAAAWRAIDAAEFALCAAICREDSGSALCDSGSIYGYQYNKPVPEQALDVEELSISGVHHLAECISVDAVAADLQARFERYARRPDQERESWLSILEGFLEREQARGVIDFDGYCCSAAASNSYNWDNDLDQVFQFFIFEIGGEAYIAVQAHTGCDVRGGYSQPYFLRLHYPDYFLDMRVTGDEDGGDGEQYEGAYSIQEAAEFKDGKWITEAGGEIMLHCTAQGV